VRGDDPEAADSEIPREHRDARASAGGTPGLVYEPELGESGADITLSETESHYAARVCRVESGERLRATDGRGRIAELTVLATRPGIVARIETVRAVARVGRAWVLSGAPEGTRDDWMVEKLAELGIERWIPIDTERARWREGGSRRSRWERLSIAALRQSGSAHKMDVDAIMPLDRALQLVPSDASRWMADPAGEPCPLDATSELTAVVCGPAPGFTPDERERILAAGFRRLRLARSTLRAETAAIAWASVWAASRP
jgi:16S rRNA (uracil1498-N3)-methyltransferase